MATWMTKVNQRPAGQEVQITAEAYVIGADIANFVFLNEVPRQNTPSSVSVMQGATSFVEVTTTPATGQFRVYYEGRLMGTLEFHPTDNTKGITVTYFGRGSNVFARDINRLQVDKLDRDGAQPLQGPLRFTTGTAAAPSITFDIDSALGLFRHSSNTLGLVSNGTLVGTLSTTGLNLVTGNLSVAGTTVSLSTHTHALSSLTGQLALSQISATGTRDSTTFLRGDGTWAVPSAGGGGGGISEAFADSKYLQLTGGSLTGALSTTGSMAAERYLFNSSRMALRASTTEQAAIVAWNGLQLIGARSGSVDIVPSTEAGSLTGAGVIIPVQAASVVGLYVRAVNGQTAALTQWASGTNTVIAAVSATGVISAADFQVGGVSLALSTHSHNLSSLSGQLALSQLQASGTRDSTTFLRGDGTWAPVSSTGGGISLAEADARYLALTGGTVTGNLGVNGTLTVSGVAVSLSTHTHSANQITSGTLSDSLLSTNVSLLNTAATVSAARTYVLGALTSPALLFRVAGDTQPRYQVRLDGQLAWGPGGSTATDVFLARSSSSTLSLTGTLAVSGSLTVGGTAVSVAGHTHGAGDITTGVLADQRLSSNVRLLNTAQTHTASTSVALTASTDNALLVRVSTDTQSRFILRTDGQLSWGPGGSTAPDVTLARTGASSLSLGGSLSVSGSLSVGGNTVAVVGHTHSAADITSGTMADARLSTNVMVLNSAQVRTALLTGALPNATDMVFATRLSSDSQSRLALRADGQLLFGSGSAAGDVSIARSGAGSLSVSGSLAISGTQSVSGLATFAGNVSLTGGNPQLQISGSAARMSVTDGTVSAELAIIDSTLELRTTSSHPLVFETNSVPRWQVEASGHLTAVTDNSFDIGATSTNRPRNIYVAQGLFASSLNLNDGQLITPLLRDYGEVRSNVSLSSGTLTLNINNANVFEATLNANVTTLSILNPTPTGNACTITLIARQDATGGRTITWPASVTFGGQGAPTLSGANKVDLIFLTTVNGGTTWFGSYLLNY
jgi:hypothetical protein